MAGQRAVPDWLTATTYAHRGAHDTKAPENSLAAAERALKAGWGIECDVQRSRDGTAFVFHDWTLDRMTRAPGMIGEQSDEALQALSLLDTAQSPMRLSDFLAAIDERVPVLIEIKSQPDFDVSPTCQSVRDTLRDYIGPVAIMSFDPRALEWFADHAPATLRGLVGTDSLPNGFEGVWRKTDILAKAQPDFLALDRRDLARPEALQWRTQAKPLLTWTVRTLSEREEARPLADALIAEGEALR